MIKLNKKESPLENRKGKKISRILAVCLTVVFCFSFAMMAHEPSKELTDYLPLQVV